MKCRIGKVENVIVAKPKFCIELGCKLIDFGCGNIVVKNNQNESPNDN
jgi:hypothetical protein